MERDENLRKAVGDLPEREPDAKLWNRIEADLDFAQKLPDSLGQLPEYEPDDALWSRIESNIPPAMARTGPELSSEPVVAPVHPGTRRNTGLWTYVTGIAASVCLLLTFWWLLRPLAPSEPVQVSYSQEPVDETETGLITPPDQAAGEAVQFIRTQCVQQAIVCQSPQFQELKDQLDELDMQSRKLDQEIIRYGQDPDLIKAQIKVENLKAEVTKELIQLLNT